MSNHTNKIPQVQAEYVFNPTIDKDNKTYDLASYFFQQRVIWFFVGVSDASAQSLCSQLLYLAGINDNPIFLNIQSGGGSVYSCFSIINTISTIKAPVHITVCGLAASAAAVITAFGTKGYRSILPHARIMLHQVITGMGRTSFGDFSIHFEETKYLNEQLLNMLFDRMKLSREVFDQKIQRDWFLSAEEAVQYGICDFIAPK